LNAAVSKRARRLLLLGLLAALLIPLFLWIPTHLRHDPLIGPLGSRYHIGLFLVLTLLLYHHGPWRGRLRAVVVVCLLLAAATEVIQIPFGRTAAVADWAKDAQGVGFAVCWIWYRRTGRLRLPLLGALALVFLVIWPLRDLPVAVPEVRAARARFPLLDDFERPRALALWLSHQHAELSLVPVADRGRVLQISHDGRDRWPGAKSRKLPWDWTGHSALRLDCRVLAPSPDSLRVTVYVEDRAARRDTDFAMQSFTVGRQWQTLTVRLADLVTWDRQRAVTGREIIALSVFASRRGPGPLVWQIDNLRLLADDEVD
jgi:hypothetical protein